MKYVFIKRTEHNGYSDNGESISYIRVSYYDRVAGSWQVHILESRVDRFLFDDNLNQPNSEGSFELFDENEMITYYHEVENQLVGYTSNKKY